MFLQYEAKKNINPKSKMGKKSRKQSTSRKSRRKSSRRKSKRKKSRSKKKRTPCRYAITTYTRRQAKKHGVEVRKSTNTKKKIDVFKNGKKIASVGACGYGDYPTFIKTRGVDFAKRRRAAYKKRHEKNRHRRGSPGFYADKLLW
jgi:hypothetical protein